MTNLLRDVPRDVQLTDIGAHLTFMFVHEMSLIYRLFCLTCQSFRTRHSRLKIFLLQVHYTCHNFVSVVEFNAFFAAIAQQFQRAIICKQLETTSLCLLPVAVSFMDFGSLFASLLSKCNVLQTAGSSVGVWQKLKAASNCSKIQEVSSKRISWLLPSDSMFSTDAF